MGELPNTDCNSHAKIGINQSLVSRLIAKYRQTNDVTGRPRLSSAADDRVLVRSVVRDPKAPCSELLQQWQHLNVQASTRIVNRQLNKAGLKVRCRTFLRLDHRRNHVQRAISLSLLCIHISEHIKQHAQYFRTTMPVDIGNILLQILFLRRGLKIFSGRAGAHI